MGIFLVGLGLAFAFGLLPWFVRQRWFKAPLEGDARELASSIIPRIATLHALILALVFADEQLSLREQQKLVEREAAIITEIAYQLDRYGHPHGEQIKNDLLLFARTSAQQEWLSLSHEGQLSQESWDVFDRIFERVLALSPDSFREQSIYRGMVDRLRNIADSRNSRAFKARERQPFMFWLIALVGFFVLACLYSLYDIGRYTLAIAASFALMMALVLYAIFDYSNVYAGLLRVSPEPFLQAAGEITKILPGKS